MQVVAYLWAFLQLRDKTLFCLALLDVDVSSPDEKSVITYVSSLYDAFPKVPEGGEGIGANVSRRKVQCVNFINTILDFSSRMLAGSSVGLLSHFSLT